MASEMGKIMWMIVCFILSGFRVTPTEPYTPSYENQQERESLPRRDRGCFTTTVRGKLREDMPEFSFDVEACFNEKNSTYQVGSITVREGEEIRQVISVPELSLFGETAVWADQEESMGLELEDLNFDGYRDLRLFDTSNGNYLVEWIYLVWNPETERFDHDPRLNEIPLADFDQEEKLIYGMGRSGAASHYFYTYQYLDGEPEMIREEHSIYLTDLDPEVVRRCLLEAAASEAGAGLVETERDYVDLVEVCRETEWERNPETGEMELTRDQFRFFTIQGDELLSVEADSETGEMLESGGR